MKLVPPPPPKKVLEAAKGLAFAILYSEGWYHLDMQATTTKPELSEYSFSSSHSQFLGLPLAPPSPGPHRGVYGGQHARPPAAR